MQLKSGPVLMQLKSGPVLSHARNWLSSACCRNSSCYRQGPHAADRDLMLQGDACAEVGGELLRTGEESYSAQGRGVGTAHCTTPYVGGGAASYRTLHVEGCYPPGGALTLEWRIQRCGYRTHFLRCLEQAGGGPQARAVPYHTPLRAPGQGWPAPGVAPPRCLRCDPATYRGLEACEASMYPPSTRLRVAPGLLPWLAPSPPPSHSVLTIPSVKTGRYTGSISDTTQTLTPRKPLRLRADLACILCVALAHN